MKVAIIGGGAAGFFAAINTKENHPDASVTIFEKSSKLLSKVSVSGGGRCNISNGCSSIKNLIAGYPRGGNHLKKAFNTFNNNDTFDWFNKRGIELYTQDDNRSFPKSNNSQTIIDCFIKECQRLSIAIKKNCEIKSINPLDNNQLDLVIDTFDKVIITTGGSPKSSGLNWLKDLGHKIEEPCPSLFTFNIPKHPITKLMGLATDNTLVSIQGAKLKSEGPLLITHWGMSGPAILKLSAWGARILKEKEYQFNIQVNWINIINDELIHQELRSISHKNPKKSIGNLRAYQLPDRLWQYLLNTCKINPQKPWGELSKKEYNKLSNTLSNDIYEIKGKTTFKEEFVTCGGISLEAVNFKTMQSRHTPNLYFAGEILDIDGITGGYNFQAAWTTGFIAAKLK